jgi:hypothetical protein
MNADEVETALLNLSEAHRDFVTLIELPNRTWQDRLCRAVRVHAGKNGGGTTANNSESRTGVLITGGMHAREWGGSDICINFLTNLIDAYVNNTTIIYAETTFPTAQIKKMLESIDLFVFPDVNPDGDHPNTSSSKQKGLFSSERELILIAKSEPELRVTRRGITSAIGSDVAPLADLLSTEEVTIHPLFGVNEERMKLEVATLEAAIDTKMPNMSVYYRVEVPDERLNKIAEKLRICKTTR